MTLDEVYTDRAALETRLSTELGGSVKRIEIKKVDQVPAPPPWTSATGVADRRRRSQALLLAVALTAVACSSDEAAEPAEEAPAASAADAELVVVPPEVDDEPTPSASPFADRSTDELFDPASPTFEFTVAERDLQFLDGDPTAEEYVPATMTFEGETIEVGLRYKGSIGAFVGCVDAPTCSTRVAPRAARSCR